MPSNVRDNHSCTPCWVFSTFHDTLGCVARASYLALGGHSAEYAHGLGLCDYDLAARWAMKYGVESIQQGRGLCWHVTGGKRGVQETQPNIAVFHNRLLEFKAWLEEHGLWEVEAIT